MMADTKVIKVYRADDNRLLNLRERLTQQRGRQATYADVVAYLIQFHKLTKGNGGHPS